MKTRVLFLFLIPILLAPPAVLAQPPEVIIPGKVVTGFNRYLGQPYVDFGDPLGPASFEALGAFDPEAEVPLLLAPDTPGDTLLATYLDPAFLAIIGLDPAAIDPALLNVPLRQVSTNVFLDDATHVPLPGSDQVAISQLSQQGPSEPIDLATWSRARAVVSIRCDDQGGSLFRLVAKNLLPERLYSVWGNYSTPIGLFAFPFSGLPNAFVTDDNGRGSIERNLNGCPLDPPGEGEPVLLAIELNFHSDHMLNGAVPSVPYTAGGRGLGVITHPVFEFRIAGQELLQPEGWGDDPCLPGLTAYCLNDGRFKAEVAWSDSQGNSGSGKTMGFSSDEAGEFWFFSRANQELLVKVLDGCSFNQHFWVFSAAATDVEYTLTVTDTRTGQIRTYGNQLGQRRPAITDTSAFATCP